VGDLARNPTQKYAVVFDTAFANALQGHVRRAAG
jgi:hypothetical protein